MNKIGKLDLLASRRQRARVKLKDGRILICTPLYLIDGEREDEDGDPLPAIVVKTEGQSRDIWEEEDILEVEELENVSEKETHVFPVKEK